MTVREHYDTHLANFYSWMTGDFESKQKEFFNFLIAHGLRPSSTQKAIDLGSAHGIQSVPLAMLGFEVTAVDFNAQLLEELKNKATGLDIKIIQNDIRNIKLFAGSDVELILCCGDTLLHLANKKEIENLISDICSKLIGGGKTLLSFRDYSIELTGDKRFIPVRSDGDRILTCVLDFERELVTVTDLLYQRTETGWQQSVSSYKKVRISTWEIVTMLEANGMQIHLNQMMKGMTTILAVKM